MLPPAPPSPRRPRARRRRERARRASSAGHALHSLGEYIDRALRAALAEGTEDHHQPQGEGAMIVDHPAADLADRQLMYRRERQQARKARTLALASLVCIDTEDLILRAGPCDSSALSRLTHRRLAARALAAEGVSAEAMARGWGCTLDEARELVAAPLIDPDHEIDATEAALRIRFGLLGLE